MLVRVHDSSNHHIDSKSHPSNPARTTCSLINNLVNRTGDLTARSNFNMFDLWTSAGRVWFEMLTSSQPKCLDSTYRYPESWWMLTTLKWSNRTPTTVADRNEFEVHMEPPCVCAVGLLPFEKTSQTNMFCENVCVLGCTSWFLHVTEAENRYP